VKIEEPVEMRYGQTITLSPEQYANEEIRAEAEKACMLWFVNRMDVQPEPGTWRFREGYDFTAEGGRETRIPDMWLYTCEVVLSE